MNKAEREAELTLTIGAVLTDAKQRLTPVSSSPSLDAQVLLAELLGVGRAHVIAHPERVLTDEQASQYAIWIKRREQGEPVAYILGHKAFYDRELIVTPDVLIPRPETELLLEAALVFARASDSPKTAVDVGTGSGALAVTFAAHMPTWQVYATDLSSKALAVAKTNAESITPPITFFEGDLLTPLVERGIKVDLVMANLPYIASDEVPTLAVSQYEPVLALDGGEDGLDLVRQLLEQAKNVCNPGALILLEIGADQGATAQAAARAAFPDATVNILKDYAGLDRIVQILLP